MIEDRYKGGRFLRRWSLVGGFPACVLDALDVAATRPEAVAAVEAENARIRALVAAVEAHEAAVRAAAQADPPQPPPTAPAAILALAARRRGDDPPAGAPWLRALVRDGVVRNVVWADFDWQPDATGGPWDVVPLDEPVEIGSAWDGEAFTPPAPWGGPVPAILRLLPFLAAMTELGFITSDEAMAAARTGAVPAVVDAVFNQLPPAQAFAGRLAWAAMVDVERSNPLLNMVAAAAGKTPADMDAVFRRAGQIAAQEFGA